MKKVLEAMSPDATRAMGVRLGHCLQPGDLVLLEGELGAGKTWLVRGIAEGLGIEPRAVSSPTFTIVHEHPFDGGTLYHLDAYRLAGEHDLDSIGWNAIADDAGRVVVCEWGSRVGGGLGEPTVLIDIAHTGAEQRSIIVQVADGAGDRFEASCSE